MAKGVTRNVLLLFIMYPMPPQTFTRLSPFDKTIKILKIM
jgi:hypothetical protein